MDPMNNRTSGNTAEPGFATADRAMKANDIKSGAMKARAVRSRAGKRSRVAQPPTHSIVTHSSAFIEPVTRDAMISEAAYFRSAHRGFEPGHELDDWLAAESDIERALASGGLPRFMD
jgi:hypothetical protein